MEQVGRKPCFALLALAEFCVGGRRSREFVLFDFGDPRRDVEMMTTFFRQFGGGIFISNNLRSEAFVLRSGIEVLQASGRFKADAHDLRWFASSSGNGRGIIFDHLFHRNTIAWSVTSQL
jgi:hypothetical protein